LACAFACTMDDLPAADAPIKVYENTYHMKPREWNDAEGKHFSQRFKRSEATKILQEVLESKMSFTNERDKKGRLSYVFNSDDASEVIREIVEESQKRIIAQMKGANNDQPPRYKLVFQASFGENMGHMVRSASRCLWDAEVDNCASANWSNGRVYAVAMCFALYYE